MGKIKSTGPSTHHRANIALALFPQIFLKWWIRGYSLLFIFFFSPLFSLHFGNPSSPELPPRGFLIDQDAPLGFKLGYNEDHIFSKDWKKGLKNFHAKRHMGSLTLTIINRVEIFTNLGVMHMRFCGPCSYDADNFAYEVGAKALLIYWGEASLGLSASYMRQTHFDEWQMGLGLSRRFKQFVPYAGIGFSRGQIRCEDIRYRTRDTTSLYTGFDIATPKGFDFNLEGRFIAETALTATLKMRF